MQNIGNIHTIPDAQAQEDIDESFQEESELSRPCPDSTRLDVDVEIIDSATSRHVYKQGPHVSSVSTSSHHDYTEGRDDDTASTSSHHDCEEGRDLALPQHGLDSGSVENGTQHIKTPSTSSMPRTSGNQNVGGEIIEWCGPVGCMFALEAIDVREQILIQRLLDEQKLKEDPKVIKKLSNNLREQYDT